MGSARQVLSVEAVADVLGPGDYFGVDSLLTGEPLGTTYVAADPTDPAAVERHRQVHGASGMPVLRNGIATARAHARKKENGGSHAGASEIIKRESPTGVAVPQKHYSARKDDSAHKIESTLRGGGGGHSHA